MVTPSGRQTVLVHGDQRATVVEVGGGLRTYTVGGRPVLDGYDEDAQASGGRGQPLLPWPNRVDGGRWRWEGRNLQIPLNEPEHGNAIHGLTRWANWDLDAAGTSWATVTHRLHPQPGWPAPLDLAIRYELGDDGLSVELTVVNPGDGPCPFGAGFHPYLHAFGGTVDDVILTAPGSTSYQSDERGLPVGHRGVDGGPDDYRAGRLIGDQRMDVAFTDLERDTDGRATVTLARPATAERTQLWLGPGWTHLMIFTGDTLTDPAARRRGLAVEPMTAAPDMLNSGDGRVVLGSGDARSLSWGIRPG